MRSKRSESLSSLRNVITFVPFYCLESWTYYNSWFLRQVCHHPDDGPVLDSWEQAPDTLEEAIRPWSMVSAGKSHNRGLTAARYPSEIAFGVEKSFHDTVVTMLGNDQLVSLLEQTVT
jgi:hypothetical protein